MATDLDAASVRRLLDRRARGRTRLSRRFADEDKYLPSPVRVLIDTTYAQRAPFWGTGIYITRLCEELRRRDELELIEVFNRRRRPPAGGGVRSARNLAGDLWWTAVELPRLARRDGSQVVIHHPLPGRAPLTRVPQVVTVVDLAFERLPQHFDRRFRL